MSGLSRTPGKRVRVNSPPRVRIPLSPPAPQYECVFQEFLWLPTNSTCRFYPINGGWAFIKLV